MQQSPDLQNLTTEQIQRLKYEQDIDERNRPFTDEDLDMQLPGVNQGYEVRAGLRFTCCLPAFFLLLACCCLPAVACLLLA